MGASAVEGDKIKVTINLRIVGSTLTSLDKRYITISELARRMGTSTKVAGRILSKLENMGYVKRYSNRTYMILSSRDR